MPTPVSCFYRYRNAESPWCPLRAHTKAGVIGAFLGGLYRGRGAQSAGLGTAVCPPRDRPFSVCFRLSALPPLCRLRKEGTWPGGTDTGRAVTAGLEEQTRLDSQALLGTLSPALC